MNDSESWAQAFRLYEQLRVVVDMKDSNLWAQGYRCYAQHKAINEMENSNSWVISQPKGSFAAQRWWKEGKKFFAAVSQLQNTLRNGALAVELGVFMLHSHFAAVKHPAKWGLGCEIGSFYASQSFYSCKTPCEMGLWLRNLEFFMLRSHFAAAKWGSLCCEMALVCQKWFRREGLEAANWFCSKVLISWRLRNLADPCFCPVFAPFLLRKTSFQFLCIFFYLRSFKKTKLHQNKLELRHWNQN